MSEDESLLREAARLLYKVIARMRMANGFEQLGSGYGAETYEETLKNIALQIKDYLKTC